MLLKWNILRISERIAFQFVLNEILDNYILHVLKTSVTAVSNAPPPDNQMSQSTVYFLTQKLTIFFGTNNAFKLQKIVLIILW